MKHMLPSQLCTDGETEVRDLYWLKVTQAVRGEARTQIWTWAPGPVLPYVAWLPDYPILGTKSLNKARV